MLGLKIAFLSVAITYGCDYINGLVLTKEVNGIRVMIMNVSIIGFVVCQWLI